MDLLIVAATHAEVLPTLKLLDVENVSDPASHSGLRYKKLHIDVLITGIGMVATAFHLSRHLAGKTYDLAINAGIAGSFSDSLKKGDVVSVTSDCFPELGAEDGNEFISIFDMGLIPPGQFPFTGNELVGTGLQYVQKLDLRNAKGVTVNKVHGNTQSIEKLKQQYQTGVESMEGAAFFYSCLYVHIPCVQIRSISNELERRNRDNWDIDTAVRHLNSTIHQFLDMLNNE